MLSDLDHSTLMSLSDQQAHAGNPPPRAAIATLKPRTAPTTMKVPPLLALSKPTKETRSHIASQSNPYCDGSCSLDTQPPAKASPNLPCDVRLGQCRPQPSHRGCCGPLLKRCFPWCSPEAGFLQLAMVSA